MNEAITINCCQYMGTVRPRTHADRLRLRTLGYEPHFPASRLADVEAACREAGYRINVQVEMEESTNQRSGDIEQL